MLSHQYESVTLLGGKIEALDKPWREGRKARLLEKTAGVEREKYTHYRLIET
jgi:hypothetical protein